MLEGSDRVGSIPITVWTPDVGLRGVVLLGHGLGADRNHQTNRVPAERLAEVHHLAVVAPDLPLHGERSDATQSDIVEAWQAFWANGGWRTVAAEWAVVADYAVEQFRDVPLGYFGLSLGTQHGLPFLAGNENVDAAVLGLFGSLPEPKTPLMNHFGPDVTCPVFFIQQLDDEIHPADTTRHLFERLGSAEKRLEANPGRHGDIPEAALARAAMFLAERLDDSSSLRGRC